VSVPLNEEDESRQCDQCDKIHLKCVSCVPGYLKVEHIKGGYRHNYSWGDAAWSLFGWHNETLNVWTHLIGFVIFAYITYYTLFVNPTFYQRLGQVHSILDDIDLKSALSFLYSSGGDIGNEDAAVSSSMPSQNDTFDDGGGASGGSAPLLQDILDRLLVFAAEFSTLRDSFFADARSMLSSSVAELEASALATRDALSEMSTADSAVMMRLSDAFERVSLSLRDFVVEIEASNEASAPIWPLVLYLLSCKLCLAFSALFHLFCAVRGAHVHRFFCRLDYAGISLLIAGSYLPVIFYMRSLDSWRWFYMVACVAIASGCIFFTFCEACYQPKWRTFRALMYVAFGLFGVAPGTHAALIYGASHPFMAPMFWRLCLMGALYIFGALLYILRIPERWWSGRFDIWFHSHQFFHVLVVVAALTHYSCAADLWEFSHFPQESLLSDSVAY
jgi:adiponectin receptor